MPKLKLTYFDFHGGRGEPARLALSIGGIPFEDDRVAPSDWQRRKPDTPFGALPVLEVDGQTLAESNAINSYVGKLTGRRHPSTSTCGTKLTCGKQGRSQNCSELRQTQSMPTEGSTFGSGHIASELVPCIGGGCKNKDFLGRRPSFEPCASMTNSAMSSR